MAENAKPDRTEEEREVVERHRREGSPDPHHPLTNRAVDPDPTEWPDPYEERPDPRDPASVDTPALPAEREAADEAPRDPSTSDPPPPRGRDQARVNPPER
jgi:hypothetical protein